MTAMCTNIYNVINIVPPPRPRLVCCVRAEHLAVTETIQGHRERRRRRRIRINCIQRSRMNTQPTSNLFYNGIVPIVPSDNCSRNVSDLRAPHRDTPIDHPVR